MRKLILLSFLLSGLWSGLLHAEAGDDGAPTSPAAMTDDANAEESKAHSIVLPGRYFDEREVYGYLFGAITLGGDDIAEEAGLHPAGSPSDVEVTGGGIVQLGGGARYHDHGAPMLLELGLSWQGDVGSTADENDEVYFSRWPVDFLVANTDPRHRVAAGVTWHVAPRFHYDYQGTRQSIRFDNALGYVLEYGYILPGGLVFGARYVGIEYEDRRADVDGSHLGLMVRYYFGGHDVAQAAAPRAEGLPSGR